MDEELETLIRLARPMLKGHIKRTRELLTFLTELDKRLDTQSQEAERSNGEEERQAA